MRRTVLIIVAITALALNIAAPAWTCSTFLCGEGDSLYFGKNYDWNVEDGLLMVNKRGLQKSAAVRQHAASWTSKFGSVTFNQYGREWPSGGMNEAGLVVEVRVGDGKHPRLW